MSPTGNWDFKPWKMKSHWKCWGYFCLAMVTLTRMFTIESWNAADHFIVWVAVVCLFQVSMWLLKNIYGMTCVCRHWNMETMYLSNTQIKQLESLQGTLLKSSLGLSVHSHHSKLIRALNVAPVGEIIKKTVCDLWNRIFMVDSPSRDLCSHFMSRFIVSGKICLKTLFSRILNIGVSPLLCTLNANVYKSPKIF